MKKINQHKLLAGIYALLLFTACDFEELDTNLFEMTDEIGIKDGIAVGGVVMAMQRAVITVGTQASDTEAINQYQVAHNLSADSWGGFFGQNSNWYSGSNNTTYYLQDNWVAATHTNSYTTLLSSWKKIKQESEKNETPEILALVQILKISAQYKTFGSPGSIPYIHAGEPALVVPFDSEQVVFNAIFVDLTAAIEALTVRTEQGVTIVADYDAVYAGDTRKWVKYTNSLMLRPAMRISYADRTTAQKYARQASNHPFGAMTSRSDEAQMSTGAGMVSRNNIDWLANQYNECRTGSSMSSYLLGCQDPRPSAHFEASPSAYAVTAFDGENYQVVPPGNTNRQNTTHIDFSKPNTTPNTPAYRICASEAYLPRTEAALRWGSESGDTGVLYEQGVVTPFNENGASLSVDGYLASGLTPIAHNMRASYYSYNAVAPATATPAFSGGMEQKLEKIMIQKWIALYPNGHEVWTEWRRVGYPKLNQVQTNCGQGVTREDGIRRMVYLVSFYQSAEDRANHEEVLKLLGGLDKDRATTQLWWDCKNKIY